MTTTDNTTNFDLNSLTFGIEIETHIPAGAIPVGSYHNGITVAALPGWIVERDGSIDAPYGRQPAEFISPVLKGAEGLKEVIKAIEYIKSIGGQVNRSCGFHVHVGWSGDEKALKRLVGNASYYEKALYASSGTRSRESGSYCRTVRQAHQNADKFIERQNDVNDNLRRYSVLNLTNLTRRPAVKFRVFSGTLNATKAIGFIRLSLAMVEASVVGKRIPKWEPGEDSYTKADAKGKAELKRLFKGIGWIKGNQPRAFGVMEVEGIPSLDDTKAELIRLADKYDAGNQD